MAALLRSSVSKINLNRLINLNLNKLSCVQHNHNINERSPNFQFNLSSQTFTKQFVRFQSTTLGHTARVTSNETSQSIPTLEDPGYIPEPPPIPESQSGIADLTLTDELLTSEITTEVATLASQGLGGWWPPGLIQEYLNFIHVSLDLPWFAAIFAGTLIARILMFPIVIKGQKQNAHMATHMPQMQVLQFKMTEARKTGNAMESNRIAQELMMFMTEKKINPLKNMMFPLMQAPVFISFFIGLRKMANLPMESMKDGGVYWFTNLTIADPYYILPVLTSLTLLATIELGADGIRASNMQMAKYFLRAMPVIIFPFMINFPAALLCYWLSSNFISLIQVGVLKIPSVRVFFKIPKVIPAKPEHIMPKKGFVDGFKETIRNSKITREVEERARIDEVAFKKSGMGPVPKTYSYDPTKQNKSIMAKKSDR